MGTAARVPLHVSLMDRRYPGGPGRWRGQQQPTGHGWTTQMGPEGAWAGRRVDGAAGRCWRVSRMVTTTLAVFCFSLHLNSSSSSSFHNSLGVVILHHHLLLFVVVTGGGGGGDVRCCVHQSSSPPRSYFGHKLKVELSLLPRTSHAPPPPPPLGLLPPAAERCVYGCCSASVSVSSSVTTSYSPPRLTLF